MQANDYEIVIQPNRSWLKIDWAEILQYRDLLFIMVWRDYASKYQQTILGPLWFIVQPLVTTAVFTVFFGRVLNTPTDGIPAFLFYLCGMLGWSYFANSLTAAGNIFVSNAGLFTKVYFPRLVVPFSILLSNLVAFGIQLVTFLVFYFYSVFFSPAADKIHPNLLACLMLPLVQVLAAALALGVGLCLSSITAKYRDFQNLTAFLVQLWMYATPIVYPLSKIPAQWQWAAALNPMTVVVESYKLAFFGVASLKPGLVVISVSITVAVLICGLLSFNRVQRTFADTV